MTEDKKRAIELEIEVEGTPEEVWEAIATGPGISSWYVPTTVEEREGGAVSSSFGPGMEAKGRVAAWEPPHRVLFDGGEEAGGLAFEWLVEARDGGSCIVRLVNSGFGDGGPWDDQYDAMTDGWSIFLHQLQLHRTHFPGRHASVSLPMVSWPGPREKAWTALTERLGIPSSPAVGERIRTGPDAPGLAGTVSAHLPGFAICLVLDAPASGTAFLAAEGHGDEAGVSVWSYLYGDDAAAAAAREETLWRDWLESNRPG